jgi:hypothetical protein
MGILHALAGLAVAAPILAAACLIATKWRDL